MLRIWQLILTSSRCSCRLGSCFLLVLTCPCIFFPLLQVIVQDVPLDSYVSMGRFLQHFQPQACILMVRRKGLARQQQAAGSRCSHSSSAGRAGARVSTHVSSSSLVCTVLSCMPALCWGRVTSLQTACLTVCTVYTNSCCHPLLRAQESPAWPVLVESCAARNIRLGLLNARMSSRAFLAWFQRRVARALLRRMLAGFSLIVPQSDIVSGARELAHIWMTAWTN